MNSRTPALVSQTPSLSKNEAQRKLNYLEESFYRPTEVFPVEAIISKNHQKQDEKSNLGLLQTLLQRKQKKSPKTSLSNKMSSMKPSIKIQLVDFIDSCNTERQQQMEFGSESVLLAQSASQQQIRPPKPLRIKEMKNLQKEEEELQQSQQQRLKKQIVQLQKDKQRLQANYMYKNSLLYDKDHLDENLKAIESLKEEIKVIDDKIEKLSSKITNHSRKHSQEFQKSNKSIIEIDSPAIQSPVKPSIIERKSFNKLQVLTPSSPTTPKLSPKGPNSALRRGLKKLIDKRQAQEMERQKKEECQKLKKEQQQKRIQEDLELVRSKAVSRYQSHHSRQTSNLIQELMKDEEQMNNRIVEYYVEQHIRKISEVRKEIESDMILKRQKSEETVGERIWSARLVRSSTDDSIDEMDQKSQSKIERNVEINEEPMDIEASEVGRSPSPEIKEFKLESQRKLYKSQQEKQASEKFSKRKEFLDLIKLAENFQEGMDFTEIQIVQIKYILETLAKHEVPLPLLHKIKNKKLYLENYLLNNKCDAVCIIIEYLGQIDLQGIVLSNNYTSDEGIAKVIQSILKTKHIKLFSCEKNQVGRVSAEALIELLKRPYPDNLETLKLIDSKLTSIPLSQMLTQLQLKCWLKQLTLNKVNMTQDCLEILADIVNNQQALHALNISWNEFTQKTFLDFLNMIKENQSLRELTLNMLPVNGPLSNTIVNSITDMILFTHNLIHLELSHCGILEQEAITIAEAMYRSRTLQSVHLSGNLISKAVRAKLNQILKVQGKENQNQKLRVLKRQIQSLHGNEAFTRQKLQQEQNGEDQGKQLQFKTFERQNTKSKYTKGLFFTMPEDILIYTRKLGHCEIPNAYVWKQREYCWICEKWQYVVIIYTSPITQQDISQYQRINSQLNKAYQRQFRDNHERRIIEQTQGEAEIHIAGDGDQHFSKMLPLEEFVRKLEENYATHYQFGERYVQSEDHEINFKKKRNEERGKRVTGQLSLRKKLFDLLVLAKQKFEQSISIDELQEYLKELKANKELLQDQMDLQLLKYADLDFNRNQNLIRSMYRLLADMNPMIVGTRFPTLTFVDLSKNQTAFRHEEYTQDQDVFVFAKLMQPGVNSFQIRSKRVFQQEFRISDEIMLNIDVPHRSKDLNVFYKKKKKMRVNRFFQKDLSVFKKWRVDTDDMLDELFNNDIKQSKIHRTVRDLRDLEDTLAVLRKHLPILKEIYGYCASTSSYPNISWLDFSDFCYKFKLIDKNLTIPKIDMAFIATNVELISNDDNPDRDLNRYEFLEILVRMANDKYKKPGICKKFSTATNKLIQDCIIHNYAPLFRGQEFRLKILWALEVDDVLLINMQNCKKLFEAFLATHKRRLDLMEAVSSMQYYGSQLQLDDDKIKQCYVYSKMTVLDVNHQSKFEQMNFTEFLEFIGRVAHIVSVPQKAKEALLEQQIKEELGLAEKIEYVLDILLPKIKCQRKPRLNLKDKYESDSDYD